MNTRAAIPYSDRRPGTLKLFQHVAPVRFDGLLLIVIPFAVFRRRGGRGRGCIRETGYIKICDLVIAVDDHDDVIFADLDRLRPVLLDNKQQGIHGFLRGKAPESGAFPMRHVLRVIVLREYHEHAVSVEVFLILQCKSHGSGCCPLCLHRLCRGLPDMCLSRCCR